MKIDRSIITGLIMLCAVYTASAAVDVLVSDTFLGTSLDEAWETGLVTSSFTVLDDNLEMAAASGSGAQRALIGRVTDSSGNTLYNGVKMFNFYDHKLMIDVDLQAVAGAARISYFIGICNGSAASNYSPYDAEDGVYLALDLDSTGYRIISYQRANGGTVSVSHIGYISGVPTHLAVVLDGNNWSFGMGGATFTQGTFSGMSSASGSVTVDESAFDDFILTTGLRQIVGSTTTGEMTLGSVTVSTETTDPLPEGTLVSDTFSGVQLSTNWAAYGTAGSSATVLNGDVTIDIASANNAYRSHIVRTADETGSETYNGAATFNFYDHPLSLSSEFTMEGAAAAAGAAVFYYFGVSSDVEGGATLSPNATDDGLFYAVKRILVGENPAWDQLYAIRRVGGTDQKTLLGNISGSLTGITIGMDGNDWTIQLDGGATVGGAAIITNSFAGIGESDFDEFYLITGTWNSGNVATGGTLILQNLEVSTETSSAVPAPELLPTEQVQGGLRISWTAVNGGTYILQSRTNLVEGAWSNRVEDISGIDGMLSVTNDFSVPAEYFRVIAY